MAISNGPTRRFLDSLSSTDDHVYYDLIGETGRVSNDVEALRDIPGWSTNWTVFTQSQEWIDPILLRLFGFSLGAYKETPRAVAIR